MKLLNLAAGALALAITAGSADAQNVFLNEIYASHSGTDDQEFIELVGTPGLSLNNHLVLVVEGQSPSNGILDRVWDLSTLSIPASGHFVLGDTLVTPNDFNIGVSNTIENGTETFYLVDAGANVAAIQALIGTDISVPPASGSTVTVIPSMSTVLDSVAMLGTNLTVFTYDGATVIGPDPTGPFFPAGIFRPLDHPNPWCTMNFLDFNPAVNAMEPSTAGAINSPCSGGGPGTSFCDDADGSLASCPCSNPGNVDSGCDIAQGSGGVLATVSAQDTAATTGTITCTGYPPMATPSSILIRATDKEATPVVFGDGLRCVGLTNFVRLAATTAVSGTAIHSFGHGAGTGTFHYQAWFRNTPNSYCVTTGAFGGAFNLSNGQSMTW